jgi:tellurite methyltransferase
MRSGKIPESMATPIPRAVEFFGAQFERQIAAHDYKLNPFEERALPYLTGKVLDLGCGLGNLSLAAAARGAQVTAFDACENAVDDLAERALASGLNVWVRTADLRGWRPEETYDAVNCIGLLMFFAREDALAGLAAVHDAVRPAGVAVVNAMIEGSTFLAMFDPAAYYLFRPEELAAPFAGWEVLHDSIEEFPAAGDKLKRFRTLIVRRPAS